MKTFELKGETRKNIGSRFANKSRANDLIPCVLYGGKEVIHFQSNANNFLHLVYTPNSYLIDLDIDGKKYQATMHDLQFDSVSDKLDHIDFLEVTEDKPVTVKIPIKLTGVSVGVSKGGKLKSRATHIKVKALAKNLPDVLNIDITNVEIGKSIHIKDLNFPNLTLVEKPENVIITVISSRAVAKGMDFAETTKAAGTETAAATAAAGTPATAKAGDAKAPAAKAPAAKAGDAKKPAAKK